MATKKRRKIAKRGELTTDQFFSLLLGDVKHDPPTFESPFMRRAAWYEHRDEMMTDWDHAGVRPQAWWDYDAPEPLKVIGKKEMFIPLTKEPEEVHCLCGEIHMGYICVYEDEVEYLRRMGFLEDWEEAELEVCRKIRERNKAGCEKTMKKIADERGS